MNVWETEDESVSPSVVALPTPADTPYRTPSRTSRKSSRRSVTPPAPSSSPPPMPSERGSKRSSRDASHDENISILDPRRFTPTLHANLVSEILNLRRDQEEKTKIIEDLESHLHSSREESETLQGTLLTTAKENRSLKRQLALLEGGTSSALGELARERDEAVDTASETRKRLDAAQKKLRSREEESERLHDQWAKDKDAWAEEKRRYERKIHVAEARLKALLDEIAAYQASSSVHDAPESEVEEGARDNDAASIRTMSMTNSVRFSTMSAAAAAAVKANGHSLADELNFDADDDDDGTDYGGRESVLSNNHYGHHNYPHHGRNASRESFASKSNNNNNNHTHKRNQSVESLKRPGSVAARSRLALHATLERLEGDTIREDDEGSQAAVSRANYTDTGVQFSPPPSPQLAASKPATPEPAAPAAAAASPAKVTQRESRELESSPPRGDWEVEANQRRKRVHVARALTIEPASLAHVMVNGSSQTVEEPLSPPKTPRPHPAPAVETSPPPPPPSSSSSPRAALVSTATQTEDDEVAAPPPLGPSLLGLPPLPIPSISIIPPTSRPTTPREPRLPQLFKDFGCQVSMPHAAGTRTVAVQTEEIRVDKRLDRLPAHLHPSAITSRPTSPAAPPSQEAGAGPDEGGGRHFTPVPGYVPPRNPRRLTSRSSLTEEPPSSPPPPPHPMSAFEGARDAYPGNNDDGPLSSQRAAPVRRPHRISSLFAGFDAGSSDEVDEFGDVELSDSEYRTALSAPRPKAGRPAKRGSGGGHTTSPEQAAAALVRMGSGRSIMRPLGGTEIYSSFVLPDARDGGRDLGGGGGGGAGGARAGSKGLSSAASSNRAGVMRKAAMIQNGIATHQRARSPSLPEAREPPFPIPTRASSRKPPISASAPSDGRASPTRSGAGSGPSEPWHRRGGAGRSHYRANSIRKVRSAAVLPRNAKYRRGGSRSPPPFSPTESPPSPDDLAPPLPRNDVTTTTTARGGGGRYRTHRSELSTNTADTGVGSVASSNQATSVVDAIAQTMVGEWMFKYVRRRKSFGVAEGRAGDDSSNDRHKRWVWLAPYERAILWSSKQPSSGSALMGKSGRKLTIQSVLDVKDDNPPPKGAGPVFNRSILILTPQRALKFTAVSAERHYLWLTSLSFLAHSQQAVPEILPPAMPQRQAPDHFGLPPPAKLRRAGIRDSIRLAKGKTTMSSAAAAVARSGQVSVASSSHTDSAPPSIPSYRPTAAGLGEPFPAVVAPPLHVRDDSREAAEAPHVPRFQERANQVVLHGRKRSNTGGHVPPPLSFRGFSGPAGGVGGGVAHHAPTNSTAGNSTGTAGSSDIYNQSQASSGNMTWGMSTAGSVRTSEASSRPSGMTAGSSGTGNFFDAIGTVRMEAFISPLAFTRFDETGFEMGGPQDEVRQLARRRSKERRRRASRSRHRDSYQSRGTRGTDDTEEWYARDDPFRGF